MLSSFLFSQLSCKYLLRLFFSNQPGIKDQALYLVFLLNLWIYNKLFVLLLFIFGLTSHSSLSSNKTHQKSKTAYLKGRYRQGQVSTWPEAPGSAAFLTPGRSEADWGWNFPLAEWREKELCEAYWAPGPSSSAQTWVQSQNVFVTISQHQGPTPGLISHLLVLTSMPSTSMRARTLNFWPRSRSLGTQ